MGEVSSRLLDQRVRNRIYEECSWFVEFEHDDYPVTHHLISDWYDWWHDEAPNGFGPPVYTEAEVTRLVEVGRAMDTFADRFASKAVDLIPKAQLCASHEWRWLVHTAHLAILEMDKRGKFSEEIEESFPS